MLAYVSLCWLYVGPTLVYVSPILAYVGPVLALCWPMLPMLAHLGAYVEAMLAISETISVERLPRCQFPFPDPSAEPKPRKNQVFFPFANDKKSIGRGYETPQTAMFL